MDPIFELKFKPFLVAKGDKLEAAKAMVDVMENQPISLISNLPEIIEATDLLVNSLIPENQKMVLANIRD